MDYYLEAFRHYADFHGRIRRKTYWMFILFNIIFSFICGLVDATLGTTFIGSVYSLVLFVPSISAAARRLHDTGRTGWWQLMWLVPVIGWIVMIVLLVQDSQSGENDFGANPKAANLDAASTQ